MPEHSQMEISALHQPKTTSEKESDESEHLIRIMTYNIHSCVDTNRNVNPSKLVEIIAEHNADIIALQEVDDQMPLRENQNQARFFADELGMKHIFFPTENSGLHKFGLAILSRFPFNRCHCIFLPNLYPRLKPRKRGSIRASIQTPAGPINLINTHLSLFKLERRKQLKTLLGESWLMAVPEDEPVVICGDMNAGPLSKTYRTLSRYLTDVQKDLKDSRSHVFQPTFHSKSPLFRIDHIFVSAHLKTISVEVRRTPGTQTASDHLPVVADLTILK
jgi:endonuclease/exonuclease/phosphatase family metal-dependent hydrolase